MGILSIIGSAYVRLISSRMRNIV